MEKFASKNGVSVRAYKGDAMTMLCFDLAPKKIKNFTGFSIKVTPPKSKSFFLFNRIIFEDAVLNKSKIDRSKVNVFLTDCSPLQTFSWIHVPGTDHNINKYIYGNYSYEITARYLINDVLQPLDPALTVKFSIDVSPYKSGKFKIGFTRGFIESQAYTRHFGLNNATRPNKTDLLFDLNLQSGPKAADLKKNPNLKPYTFKDQHEWLGWQARNCIKELLDETLKNKAMSLDVFAFDLNEPYICDKLIELGKQGRVRIILDDSSGHSGTAKLETKFSKLFAKSATDKKALVRGHFSALSHSKLFIQKKDGKALKVLGGSTNFSTNGLYINANHVIVFEDASVAELFESIFNETFGKSDTDTKNKMKLFKKGSSQAKAFKFTGRPGLPDMTIRFAPHVKMVATTLFDLISKRILSAKSDLLFAIMNDHSASSILDSVREQVKNASVFTYGITNAIGKRKDVMLYKPQNIRGVRVAGKPANVILPDNFDKESKIPGVSIHHKFVVVDFKGRNPVVYCGSTNLAFGPEQANGDNMLEIRDRDAVTVFAIEAMRLVDHFHFRNAHGQFGPGTAAQKKKTFNLHGSSEASWVNKYFDPKDQKCMERELLVREAG